MFLIEVYHKAKDWVASKQHFNFLPDYKMFDWSILKALEGEIFIIAHAIRLCLKGSKTVEKGVNAVHLPFVLSQSIQKPSFLSQESTQLLMNV